MNPSHDTFSRMLMDRNTTASALIVGLVDQLGTECLNYEPDTLLHEIRDHWKVTPPEFQMDKIWSISTVMTTDYFSKNFLIFNHICASLSNAGTNFERFVPSDITEICWGLMEISLIDPDEAKRPFSQEIKDYIALKLEDEGLHRLPKILSKHVSLKDRSQEIGDSLQDEAIDQKAFWDSQSRSLLQIDRFCQEKMIQLVTEVAALPLKHAAPGAQQDLLMRAQKALRAQSQQTEREQADVPLAASL